MFDPSYISDVPAAAVRQRSHPMQLRSAKYRRSPQYNEYWGFTAKQQHDTVVTTVKIYV